MVGLLVITCEKLTCIGVWMSLKGVLAEQFFSGKATCEREAMVHPKVNATILRLSFQKDKCLPLQNQQPDKCSCLSFDVILQCTNKTFYYASENK